MTIRKKILEGEELTFDEATQSHPQEWVLLKVTRMGEDGWVSHGHVLEHSADRKKINKTLQRFWEQEPDGRVAILFGGKWGRTGDDLRKAIEEAAKHYDFKNALGVAGYAVDHRRPGSAGQRRQSKTSQHD